MALSASDNEVLQRILLYRPQSRYEQVSMQLFGMPGHGKSSIVNTCMQIVHQGTFTNVAGSGQSNYPITLERLDYQLTPKVLITDNRGICKMSLEEQEEMAAQMGQLRRRSKVKWDRSLREKLDLICEQYKNRPKEIIVPVFVYSAESLLTNERYEELEPFIREAQRMTDIYPIIVLTKVATHRNMAAACYSKFKEIGANNIFQVENYTVERHEHNPETEAEILRFLNTCLQEAEESVGQATADPQNKFMSRAMDQVHHILEKESEKNEMKFKEMEEKHKESKEKTKGEVTEIRNKLEDKEQELQKLRQSKKPKSKCSVM